MNNFLKLAFLILSLVFSLSASSQGRKLLEGVDFGMPMDKATAAIQRIYGAPEQKGESTISYTKKSFRGMTFDQIEFGFKEGRLVDARFVCDCKTRVESSSKMDAIAAMMKKSYEISKDKEDQGPWFYVGGISPRGIGHLFTIFMYRRQGIHCAELRYGPFNPAHLE